MPLSPSQRVALVLALSAGALPCNGYAENAAPLAAEIRPASQQQASVFMEASLDQSSVYVQAQAVLTVRVLHAIPLYDDSQFSPIELLDARVETLGKPRAYEQEINGVLYGVQEVRYALFPQRSGVLALPALQFNATALDTHTPGDMRGHPIQVQSAPLTLTVRPRPSNYPSGQPWLPARQLQLHEDWTPDLTTQVRAGEPITRTIRLRAEGLSAAQLPELNAALALRGARVYPEKPQLRDVITEAGFVGNREESVAFIPLTGGTLEIPARELLWWNTAEERLERLQLPARQFQVEALRSAEGNSALKVELFSGLVWPWQAGCAGLLLTNVITWRLWRRAKRRPVVNNRSTALVQPSNLKATQEDLRRACVSNNPHAARQALDAWARNQPYTLAELATRHPPLSEALNALNSVLYSASGQEWQGEKLWDAIHRLPVNGPTDDGSSLPPLYPR